MRMKMVISYDGTNFSGYQIQPGKRTIQGEIEKALGKMHKIDKVPVIASGRTDSGVHAIGQVIHFDTQLQIEPSNWLRALTSLLPSDIQIIDIGKVDDHFHARYDAKSKEYRYVIFHREQPDIFKRHYAYWVAESLDIDKMKQALTYIEGKHDFTSFCAANSGVKGDKIRTVLQAALEEQGDEIIFTIRGDGFLYNMVRIIVGTVVEVGKGKRDPEEILNILRAKNRKVAGKTAPAHGLFLWNVQY
ncbi:tRNA pseudouridine38-40 synthase [Gracilibacillus halotolerans]|uniref:tRNA pseudouridine synthase A n=1 Tax=Gracilibacillus halotolerans TaxID=74386 RepID=A0A841RPS8_9BACI|nr:tRNA pseudouridine(38-40) synthase TruA [Gracilibacillus halotolerans]MBB6512934.1 tRNA pseudouridine38-40 synthase [Gracilibacillus halotolerans]